MTRQTYEYYNIIYYANANIAKDIKHHKNPCKLAVLQPFRFKTSVLLKLISKYIYGPWYFKHNCVFQFSIHWFWRHCWGFQDTIIRFRSRYRSLRRCRRTTSNYNVMIYQFFNPSCGRFWLLIFLIFFQYSNFLLSMLRFHKINRAAKFGQIFFDDIGLL